jgi:hypothetical protein
MTLLSIIMGCEVYGNSAENLNVLRRIRMGEEGVRIETAILERAGLIRAAGRA